jgi:hypothetical protein
METPYKNLLPFALLLLLPSLAFSQEPPSFVRDIRPILARNCFACHGPDEENREAELRLDDRSVAVKQKAIVPGKPAESVLLARIASQDEFERMPPPDAGKPLTEAEQDLLRRWIANGAKYEEHWAFVPPKLPDLPPEAEDPWVKNPIDAFVFARLKSEGLSPSPQADRITMLRRVTFDLTGLPPKPEDADAFASTKDPQAYQDIVSRLLASQEYGEHWARAWLDLARYADTNGYEKDRPRSIWPYRDWVIKAINEDMPFDEFTVQQLAGDMLPGATQSQKIATGFHRNTMLNEEGGIDPLEFRFYAMVDRVATTGAVWLGLTTGCAQCHTHKYDPITHTDYYSMMALLNNADEPDLLVKDTVTLKQRAEIEKQVSQLQANLPKYFPPAPGDAAEDVRRQQNLEAKFTQWLKEQQGKAVAWQTLIPTKLQTNLPRLEVLEDGSIFSTGDITKRDVFSLTFPLDKLDRPIVAIRLEVLPDDSLPASGPGRCYYEGRRGDFFLSELNAATATEKVKFASGSHSYGKISIGNGTADAKNVFDGNGSTGWSTSGGEGKSHQLVLNFAKPLEPNGKLNIEMIFERHFAASLGRFRISVAPEQTDEREIVAKQQPVEIEALLAKDVSSITQAERNSLQDYYLSVTAELAEARKEIDALRNRLPKFGTTLVMEERPADNPRTTHRHHRGEYLSPEEEVTPAVPTFLQALPESAKANRLSFARWLVSERNPLVARVTVNRRWQAFFGTGLVRTPDDFGTQSSPPSHPELLDYLAVQFITPKSEGGLGWSTKALDRLIVTSATYQQSSHVSKEMLATDPENRLLARGPRFRVKAEVVRDIFLTASGKLTRKLGGPSVRPPQPGIVTAVAYGNGSWPASTGADRFRRSLYTFSKRTAPFAAYAVFDAPSGENCIARRNRSNTPLQSLTLLNDEMILELARALADNAMAADTSDKGRAVFIFRQLLTRVPTESESSLLIDYQQKQLARLQSGELKAAEILGSDKATNAAAAWFLVARAVMNLDEVITKQ